MRKYMNKGERGVPRPHTIGEGSYMPPSFNWRLAIDDDDDVQKWCAEFASYVSRIFIFLAQNSDNPNSSQVYVLDITRCVIDIEDCYWSPSSAAGTMTAAVLFADSTARADASSKNRILHANIIHQSDFCQFCPTASQITFSTLTRLPSNLRPTTCKCVHLVTCNHL